MQRIGIWELIVILLIVVILFGPKKLPEIGRAIGEAIRGFRKSLKGAEENVKRALREDKDDKKG